MKKLRIYIIFLWIAISLFLGQGIYPQDEMGEIIDKLLEEKKPAPQPQRTRATEAEATTPQTWEFVAEGSAAFPPGMDKPLAREQAIRDALRNAVEQGVGIFVGDLTLVRNYAVAFDSIFTQAAGYVRTYNVIKEWTENGIYRVKVLAEVGMGKLQSDLMAIETFKKLVDYPRIMVFGKEKIDGRLAEGSQLVLTAIESVLTESGYDLIDRAQIEAIRSRDEALAETDDERVALGRRFGADILVNYDADAAFDGEDNLYGMHTFFYNGVVDCRVMKADTARLVLSRSVRVRRGAEGRPSAAQAALHYAGKELGEKLKVEVLRAWAGEVLERGVWLEIKISNINFATANQLAETMRKWHLINAVRQPTFLKGMAIYQVRANMTAPSLAQRLSILPFPRIVIDEVMQNTIKAHLQKP